MAQIYERKNQGADWGRTLATGLSSGVQALLDHKMQQMHQQKQGDVFEKLGFPRELAFAPPQIQQQFAKTMAQGPVNERYARDLQNAYEGKPVNFQGYNQQQITELGRAAAEFDKSQARQAANNAKIRQADIREEKSKVQANQSFNTELDKELKPALRQLNIIRELETLLRNGNVATGLRQQAPNWLQNKESQLARKLIGEMTQYINAGTDTQLKELLKGFPDLEKMTAEGILEILPSLETRFMQPYVFDKVRQQIIKENGNKQPYNLGAEVARRAQPELKKLYAGTLFNQKKSTAEPASTQQNKFTTGMTLDTVPPAAEFPEGKLLVNDQTGETIRVENGKWVKV